MGRGVRVVPALLAAIAFAGATAAYAEDAVQAYATIPDGQPSAIVIENGSPSAEGTYGIGTIRLEYVVHANEFPAGPFGTFALHLGIKPIASGPATSYPVDSLTVTQKSQGQKVLLSALPSSLGVSGRGWQETATVSISIADGASNEDGTTIVGTLDLETPAGSHLKTTTSVMVQIRLIHPTTCIKLYDFITDADFTETVTSTDVNVNTSRGRINATNPYGQLSDNILVSNTCTAATSYDVKVTLDPLFLTSPNGNPGNAVFTYFLNGEQDDTVDIAALGGGTPAGQTLCLDNVTLDGGDSFLATVKMAIDKSKYADLVKPSGTFTFAAQLYAPATACTGTFNDEVLPSNPVAASLSYIVK